jgi:ABC-type multidrug transport system fused ATPase/permease subunit
MGLMLVGRVAGLVLPASSKLLVDEVVLAARGELLMPLALAVALATLVQASTSFALSQVLGVTAQRAITEMRKQLHRHVMRLPVRYFDAARSGELISRVMNDAEGLRNLIGTGLVQLVGGLITASLALAVLLWLDWLLTLAILLVLALFLAGTATAFRRLRPLFRKRGELNAELTGRLGESLGGVRVVKAYTAERREQRVFARGAHRLLRNVATSITAVAGVSAISTAVLGAVGVLMILLGGRALLAGSLSLGDFVMYVFFTGLMAAPLVQVASVATQLSEAFAGLDRIRELMAEETEDQEEALRRPVARLRGNVELQGVWFEYRPGVPVLRGVSLLAPAGTTTALVGSSGSGKSTLIGLLMAFHRPTEGRVLVDGQDLEHLRLRDYRTQLGIVLQDNFLFDGTIAENIAYSRPGAHRTEIEAAGRIAHCAELVAALPDGYDTLVGERGVKLSGGQRQRVAIARAILADPRILILDEATSSLDSASEAQIQDGLAALRRGRTTFVIAHRLSTVRSADQILVLEAGQVVERGTHVELLAAAGRYRELHDAQNRLEGDRFVNPGEELAGQAEPLAPAG